MNQMIIEPFSFLNKLNTFPNQNFSYQIANRFWLHMITYDFDVVFGRLEEEVQKLGYDEKYISGFFGEQHRQNLTVVSGQCVVDGAFVVGE